MAKTTLAQDAFAHPIQALGWGTVENLAFTSGASAQSVELSSETRVVRLCADVDVWVVIAADPTASSTAGVRLPAGAVEYVRIPPTMATPKVAARGIAASGTLNVVQCNA